jgi:hypothetical protein
MKGFDRAQREYESRLPEDRHCSGCEDLQERVDNLEEDHKVEIETLRKQNERLKEVAIFYSDLYEYKDTHDQLDWDLVNKSYAIQEKGAFARQALKECEEMEGV